MVPFGFVEAGLACGWIYRREARLPPFKGGIQGYLEAQDRGEAPILTQPMTGSSRVRWRKMLGRVWNRMTADRVTGLAAEMSYYFILAFFPFLIFLAAVVGTLPFTGLWTRVLQWITLYLPDDSQRVVFETVVGLMAGRKSFLSIGLLGTVWAATGGVMSLISALNRIYEVAETRSYGRRVALALVMLLVLALFLLATFGLLTVGDWLDRWLAAHWAPGPVLVLWRVGRRALSVILMSVCLAVIDQVLPNLQRPWRWIRPGTWFVVLGWSAATMGFNFYVQHLGSYGRTYGVLGAFVVLMVWTYLVSLIGLIGAEINSELEKMRQEAAPANQKAASERGAGGAVRRVLGGHP